MDPCASRSRLPALGRILATAAALACASLAVAGDQPALPELIEKLLASDAGGGRRKAVESIVRLQPSFDALYQELRDRRRYRADVKVGSVQRERRSPLGVVYPYILVVPKSYTPTRRYPVRVNLHGLVSRAAWDGRSSWVRAKERWESEDRIAILPAAWSESRWWQASQIENVTAILREVKRTYNVDENRVSLMGFSDGGTGAWYFAFRCPTPWAAYLPFIASPSVLANQETGVEGAAFVANVTAKSFLVINGSTDPLYPAEGVRPLMEAFRKIGADVTFESEPGGHDTSWWERRAKQIDAFIDAHPRDPLPDALAWATDRTDRAHRSSWVVIDELDETAPGELTVLGAQPKRAGGVIVTRQGNTVDVQSLGVRRYRLLLSPEKFDLDNDVVVRTDGRDSFRGRVERSRETLLEWAAEDVDRTLLFAAELEIRVPPDVK